LRDQKWHESIGNVLVLGCSMFFWKQSIKCAKYIVVVHGVSLQYRHNVPP